MLLVAYVSCVFRSILSRSRASQRKATSDWMDLEKQRGISITSTVLSFEVRGMDDTCVCVELIIYTYMFLVDLSSLLLQYNNFQINLLDTPGHADFSGKLIHLRLSTM